jgi:hypothetical protein
MTGDAAAWIPTPGSRCVRRVRLRGRRPPFVLDVHLVTGGVYPYLCPSARLFLAFLAAPSKGRFYGAFVRGKLARADLEYDGSPEGP